MPADERPFHYDAFLSYTWKPDAPLVRAVRDALHRLARPWYRLRALRVFRDQSSMGSNSGLDRAIEDALDASRHLIVFLSPQVAGSPFVNDEIRYWLAHKSVETLHLVLTGGSLEWDAAAGRFDVERSRALPPALNGVHEVRPFWIDLSWVTEADQLDLRNERFRGCLVQLAAPLHGKAPDELDGEDVRQHRRTRRAATAAVTALAVLAASTAVAAVIAALRAEEALANLRQATSRYLAGQALADRDRDLDRALLLAVHAWRTEGTPAARSSLITTVHEAMRGVLAFPRIRAGDPIPFELQTLAVSPDGRRMAASRYAAAGDAGAPADGRIYVWELTGGTARVLRSPYEQAANVRRLAFGPDGRYLAAEEADGRVLLWDLATDPARLAWTGEAPMTVATDPAGRAPMDGSTDAARPASPVDVTADRRVLAAASAPGTVAFVDLLSGRVIDRRPGTLFEADGEWVFGKDPADQPVVWDPRSPRTVTVDISGPYAFAHLRESRVVLVAGAKRNDLRGYDAAHGRLRWRVALPGRAIAVAVAPSGDRAAAWTRDGTPVVIATRDGEVLGRARRVPGAEPALTFSPTGGYVVAADSGGDARRQTLLDAATARIRWTRRGDDVVFGPGDRRAVLRGTPVLVLDLATDEIITSADTDSWDATVSPDGGLAVLTGDDVHLIDLNAPEPRLIALPGRPDTIYTARFDPSGRRLAGVGAGGAAVIWDVPSALRPGDVPTAPRTDGGGALSGDTLFHKDAGQAVWRRDLRTGSDVPVPGLRGASLQVISPDGAHLLASLGREYVLWSIAESRTVLRYPFDIGARTAFSGDGRRFARTWYDSGRRGYVATIYETGTGTAMTTIPLPGFAQPTGLTGSYIYTVIALDHEGKRLAAGLTTTQLRTWDVDSGTSRGGCDDQAAHYTLATGSLHFTADPHTMVLNSDDRTVRFLNFETCEVRRSLRTGNGNAILSPDGTLMTTEEPLRLWDARTLEPLGDPLPFDDWRDHFRPAFTAGGRHLMVLTADGSLRRWPVAPDELIRLACTIAARELTPAEWTRFLPDTDPRPACGQGS
ncbi:TIR domain-containing protein [Nonomuraea sp. NPDC049419]|uniref:toll/interleukin-1 receptor domain-containing protein n=1 Tax=Nonomuraea sp. NPDC049419 TaxID=3155772 RepID=UPI003425852E